MKPKPIDLETARQRVSYDPDTGIFRWLVNNRGPARAGDIAGSKGRHGYWFVKIAQVKYPAGRLAWAMHYGYEPKDEIDHINGDRTDNRIINLRDVTREQNCQNVQGVGVRFESNRNRWLARIAHNGKQINLGRFVTEQEAIAAFNGAKATLRGEYGRSS